MYFRIQALNLSLYRPKSNTNLTTCYIKCTNHSKPMIIQLSMPINNFLLFFVAVIPPSLVTYKKDNLRSNLISFTRFTNQDK